ncbi:MAG TPA: RNA-binding cell elongation regulator Jag/EloR [bacterium]|nr:RNA-binding cell elongation regulator Jag/EloR [bacterium]
MNSAEGAGRTVEEAIRNALRTLGARREDVDLMVLDEGSRGVLGLGAREARVRLTLLSAIESGEVEETAPARPETGDGADAVAVARRVTASLVDAMGMGASVAAREEDGGVRVTVSGPQLAPLIGRHGQTLEALDLLVNLMTARQLGRRVPVAVDAERYRERRREALEALTLRVAGRVRRSGRPAPLDPMPASERRFVHTLLADDSQLTTYSEGDGPERHIVIAPRSGVAEDAAGRDPARRPQRRTPARATARVAPPVESPAAAGADLDEDAAEDTGR